MFTGLSAFPLTPLTDSGVDEAAFSKLVQRISTAGVDSICALGSTGSYAYLDAVQRARAANVAVQNAGNVPVIIGVGALSTREVLRNVEDAQNAGAAAVLLAPMTYQPLTPDEVFGLYDDVCANLSVPLIVYDNPTTTRVNFSDELHGRIAQLGAVASIKIPPVSHDAAVARARVSALRALLPGEISIGISGEGVAVGGLLAGCDAWYSSIAGVLPDLCLDMTRAVQRGDADLARSLSRKMESLFTLIEHYGSLRVVCAVAEELGLISAGSLPKPIRGLNAEGRGRVKTALQLIGVGTGAGM